MKNFTNKLIQNLKLGDLIYYRVFNAEIGVVIADPVRRAARSFVKVYWIAANQITTEEFEHTKIKLYASSFFVP